MDQRRQIQDFLSSRRARITPQQAGLMVPQHGRRVPGLRREEVATLAGLSVDYYNRLERGNLAAASDSVLNAIARALQLDETEREHLYHLAAAAQPATRARPRRTATSVAPGIQAVLDAMVGAPALVRSPVLDLLATNHLGRALYAPMLEDRRRPANFARFTFRDPRAREFWSDWSKVAEDAVAYLQVAAGIDPHDRALTELVGELSTCCEEFRVRWARRDVRAHTRGAKTFQHPVVGRLDLAFEVMQLPAEPGLTLIAYTAQPGTPAHDSLALLNAWAATPQQDAGVPDQSPAAAQRPRTGDNGTA
jgi:transcriptional regulator with XRE-family HTH domain